MFSGFDEIEATIVSPAADAARGTFETANPDQSRDQEASSPGRCGNSFSSSGGEGEGEQAVSRSRAGSKSRARPRNSASGHGPTAKALVRSLVAFFLIRN